MKSRPSAPRSSCPGIILCSSEPWFLLGALTMVGPILIHLIRRDDSRKVPFSSLMFVTRLPKKSLRRQSLRHCFSCSSAFPLFSSWRSHLPARSWSRRSPLRLVRRATDPRSSCSTTRLACSSEIASQKRKTRALQVLGSLTGYDTVQIVAYSDITTVLNNVQTDRSALRTLVHNLRPSHRKTNHLGALKLAQQLLASAPNDRLEIHWISDFQQTGWAESDDETTLMAGVTIQPFDVAEDGGGNLSLNQLRLSQVLENDTR